MLSIQDRQKEVSACVWQTLDCAMHGAAPWRWHRPAPSADRPLLHLGLQPGCYSTLDHPRIAQRRSAAPAPDRPRRMAAPRHAAGCCSGSHLPATPLSLELEDGWCHLISMMLRASVRWWLVHGATCMLVNVPHRCMMAQHSLVDVQNLQDALRIDTSNVQCYCSMAKSLCGACRGSPVLLKVRAARATSIMIARCAKGHTIPPFVATRAHLEPCYLYRLACLPQLVQVCGFSANEFSGTWCSACSR